MFQKNQNRLDAQIRINKLNSLNILKENKILACKWAYQNDGTTFCELYNKSNKKRVTIKTNVLFNRVEFQQDAEQYLKNQKYFQNLKN